MPDALRLDGRTIVITGASRGIGASVAELISSLGGGVVLVARSGDAIQELAERLPTPATAVTGDVTDPDVAERAAVAAEEHNQTLPVSARAFERLGVSLNGFSPWGWACAGEVNTRLWPFWGTVPATRMSARRRRRKGRKTFEHGPAWHPQPACV